jgi:hypothetical protein
MIAQFVLSILLAGILVYAWGEYARSPAVAMLAVFVATAGLYFVWVPEHSTQLAELVGIGRGVDLISVGKREFAGEHSDQLHLGPQFQVQIENNDQA